MFGKSIRRLEDERFLRGQGRYVADLRFDTASMSAAETAAKLGRLLDAQWHVPASTAAGGSCP